MGGFRKPGVPFLNLCRGFQEGVGFPRKAANFSTISLAQVHKMMPSLWSTKRF